jgi:hypothetical protein
MENYTQDFVLVPGRENQRPEALSVCLGVWGQIVGHRGRGVLSAIWRGDGEL